jgi:integrase/recombinase XerC
MKDQLADFLDHLRLNENASAHTVRAYESDLTQFITSVAAQLNRRRPDLLASDFNHLHIRAFLSELHKRGNSRSSAARKLAATAIGRYLRREGHDAIPRFVGTPARAATARLLAEVPSCPCQRRPSAADRAILELFYVRGLRLSGFCRRRPGRRQSEQPRRGSQQGGERIVPFNRD